MSGLINTRLQVGLQAEWTERLVSSYGDAMAAATEAIALASRPAPKLAAAMRRAWMALGEEMTIAQASVSDLDRRTPPAVYDRNARERIQWFLRVTETVTRGVIEDRKYIESLSDPVAAISQGMRRGLGFPEDWPPDWTFVDDGDT